MEIRHGITGVEFDGIFFTETHIQQAVAIRQLRVEISRQNANLDEVKRRLAGQARSCGANTVMNFRYGQRKHSWWELVFTFKWDTESWFGEGMAAKV